MAPPEHRPRPLPASIRRHTQEYGPVRGPNLGRLTVWSEERRCHPKATKGHCTAGGEGIPHKCRYDWTAVQRALDRHPDPIEREEVREEAREAITRHWAEDLASSTFGRRTLDAIGPVLDGWLNRRHGCLSMHPAQVLSGHGCFGAYLHRIGREETPKCHHCEAEVDTAEHTLEVCPSWAEPRRTLVAVVGNDLSLPSVIGAMLGSEEAWDAVASFYEEGVEDGEHNVRPHPPRGVISGRQARGCHRLHYRDRPLCSGHHRDPSPLGGGMRGLP
ncbi:hypothetical protein B5X24_HaOG202968 [Helicoverpa armigera]|uniref:Reverse transcriptase zinc-binding domain-containing protein n=1 Tax=Helicoverpa armigera TaxID=29058 RepID=A0A2W1BXC9_HELAM|nr:hypothetical protein B5X24_HaOG202968 [Helicoverpa armigera]